jgi:hypothetical protein
VLACCAAVAVPVSLELSGVWAPSYLFSDEGMLIRAQGFSLPRGPTTAFLLAVGVGLVIVPCLICDNIRDALHRAEERLHLQAGQLRQLLPEILGRG